MIDQKPTHDPTSRRPHPMPPRPRAFSGGTTQKIIRYYASYGACDFCGQPTRGRVTGSSVTCGACNRELVQL